MLRQLAGQLLGVCQHRIHASQAVLAAALTFLGSEAEQAEQRRRSAALERELRELKQQIAQKEIQARPGQRTFPSE